MSRALSLAGFQVTLIGRFWVTTVDRSRSQPGDGCSLKYDPDAFFTTILFEIANRAMNVSLGSFPLIDRKNGPLLFAPSILYRKTDSRMSSSSIARSAGLRDKKNGGRMEAQPT